MITTIEIENLRGIRNGRLEGLRPLTILTGPNASGKSAVLDALLIGASPNPADAVGRAVARHPVTLGGARWLIYRGSEAAKVRLDAWDRSLVWHARCDTDLRRQLVAREAPPNYSMIRVGAGGLLAEPGFATVGFSSDNQYVAQFNTTDKAPSVEFLRLVDPGIAHPLHQTYTAVSQANRRKAVHELLVPLVPGFQQLEILTEGDTPVLHMTTGEGSIPVSLSGDGIQAFVQLALEIAVAPDGLVLVEEPEVYQHPKAIWESARAILANVRRGVQMVLTTHSLELIDALLAQAKDEDQGGMVLFNLLLEDGELKVGRRAGEEIAFARETLERDLR